LPLQTPSVLEIDRKLRDDFRRRVKDFGVSTDATDPMLAVLFRTVAQQIDQVYSDTALLRQSLLHELMSGLEVQPYLARPAQAVVRILNDFPEPRVLRAGTELNATTSSGERLSFSLDATIEASQARLAVAFAYQNQSMRVLSGVELSESTHALRPSMDAVPVALGEQPALFLAIENLQPNLLSRHGLFFELGPDTYAIQHALTREPWWIFSEDGDLSGDGLLRPTRQNGGVHELCFQMNSDAAADDTVESLPAIADGFYTGRQFLFPPMSGSRKLLCQAPRLLRPVLAALTERGLDQWLSTPRLWIKIPMPPGIPQLHHAVNNIVLHGMTASNLFARNQTVLYARDGLSIPVVKAGGTPEFLVAPLAITSETNDPYEFGTKAGASGSAGWYELNNGRLTLHPGAGADGTPHAAANVRLWLTNGELGNHVGPGDITGFANSAALQGIRVVPFTAASGGSDGENQASEERRFADALLTRGRIVTAADLQAAALALDRRVLHAATRSVLERGANGLRRVLRLELQLDSAGFSKPEIELPGLKSLIERSLRTRLVQGLELEVEFLW
jgi:hypothetical protein